jgi:hypothetical protein
VRALFRLGEVFWDSCGSSIALVLTRLPVLPVLVRVECELSSEGKGAEIEGE